MFNDITSAGWNDIRDFLALHYKLNTALDTPFWRHCREDTDVSHLRPLLEFYAENGPTNFCRHRLPRSENDFGLEGFLVMLVGNRAPYAVKHRPTPEERRSWDARRQQYDTAARTGMDVKEALGYVRHPGWQWHGDAQKT